MRPIVTTPKSERADLSTVKHTRMSDNLRKLHFLSDDGETIHLIAQGDGSPVVLLHGWTSSHASWLPFMDALAERHRVFAWDARGHGGHALASSTPPSIQRIAKDLHRLLEHFHLNDVVLVGHSMGALTVWEYIAQFGTDRLRKLCLIDQSPKLLTDHAWKLGIYGDFDQVRAANITASFNENFADGVLRFCAHGLNDKARTDYDSGTKNWKDWGEAIRRQNPQPLIQVWHSFTQADYRHVLEKIDIPTLLVFGEQSNFYTLETAEYVRSRIPDAVLNVYAGTDHSPHLWQPLRFISELLAHAEDK